MGTEVGFAKTKLNPEQLLASSFSPVSFSSGVAEFCESPVDDKEEADYDVMTCGVCGPGASQGFAYPMCVCDGGGDLTHPSQRYEGHYATDGALQKSVLPDVESFVRPYEPEKACVTSSSPSVTVRGLLLSMCPR